MSHLPHRALCATPFAPYVSDIFGRKIGILFGSAIVLIAAILQAATQNLGMFVGSRFLIGFGTTFVCFYMLSFSFFN